MISEEGQIIEALRQGADAISLSKSELWDFNFCDSGQKPSPDAIFQSAGQMSIGPSKQHVLGNVEEVLL